MKNKIKIVGTLAVILAFCFSSFAKAANLSKRYILQSVPFTSQAPFGGWNDLRQEDGCEESSALMAVSWARSRSITKQSALNNIIGSSNYTQKKYGEYRDISTQDTLNWVIKDYFHFQNVARVKNITLASLINELEKGNVVIVPLNGQALHNPYYTAPGPKHHMMVVIGYDPVANVFITNDPGTRRGAQYKYDANLFYNAIRDYKTGFQQSDTSVQKNVIVVWK